MQKAFNCLVCGKTVKPGSAHPACRRTCGNAECQAIYQKQCSALIDQSRQRERIKKLQQQGIDLVTCAVCNQQFEMIHHNHLKKHGLTVKEYKKLYPEQPILNSRTKQTRGQGSKVQSHYLAYPGKTIDEKIYEFLTGTLLGDGSIEKGKNKQNARYVEGGKNQKYLEWKYNFLSEYFPCNFQERLSAPHTTTKKQYQGWWLRTKVHPALTDLHSQWYVEQKKIVPKNLVLQYMTEFALIIWFCDDGCSTESIRFYTLSFTESEVIFLADLLRCRFALDSTILKNKNHQYFIRLTANAKHKIREIVSAHNIPGMEYKLNF